MYEDMEEKGIRRTIISFDPFLKRADVRDLSDTQVGKRYGLETGTVKAMRGIRTCHLTPSGSSAMSCAASRGIF